MEPGRAGRDPGRKLEAVTSYLSHLTIDARDAYAQSRWWAEVWGWVVLADPEGNEFCILRSQAEADAQP